jgi:glucosamine kinase
VIRTLGIDAGGTSIRTLLVDNTTGDHLIESEHPGRNLMFNDDTIAVLTGIVSGVDAERCGIALAGAGHPVAAHHVRNTIEHMTGVPTVVVGDYVAAHYSCFGSGPGAVVIAGTGSVCYARNDAGQRVLLGGLGPVLGDEGSAWWIGRHAATAALRARQRTAPPTALVDALDERVPGGLAALAAAGTALFVDRARLARVAPLVDELADADDVARRIMTDAGHELAALVVAAVHQLGPLPTGLVGGVFSSSIVTGVVTDLIGDATVGRRPVEAAAELAVLGQDLADRLGYRTIS